MPDSDTRDLAVVLSGGGVNGVLLELGFLKRLREEVISSAVAAAPPWRRKRLRSELDGIFGSARFPFRHDRQVPSLIVRAAPGEDGLDPTFRGDEPWPDERKRALIERGYRLTDDALTANPGFIRTQRSSRGLAEARPSRGAASTY